MDRSAAQQQSINWVGKKPHASRHDAPSPSCQAVADGRARPAPVHQRSKSHFGALSWRRRRAPLPSMALGAPAQSRCAIPAGKNTAPAPSGCRQSALAPCSYPALVAGTVPFFNCPDPKQGTYGDLTPMRSPFFCQHRRETATVRLRSAIRARMPMSVAAVSRLLPAERRSPPCRSWRGSVFQASRNYSAGGFRRPIFHGRFGFHGCFRGRGLQGASGGRPAARRVAAMWGGRGAWACKGGSVRQGMVIQRACRCRGMAGAGSRPPSRRQSRP